MYMVFTNLSMGFINEVWKLGILESMANSVEHEFGPVILPPYQFAPQSPKEKVDFVLSNWYQSQLQYDISEALKKLNIPALA